jgi:hypothetical protein
MKACEKIVRSDAEMKLYNRVVESVVEEFKILESKNNGDGFESVLFNKAIEAKYKSEKTKSFNIKDSNVYNDLNELKKVEISEDKESDDDLDDDDMELVNDDDSMNTVCPYSRCEYVKPWKIKRCKHIFSKSSLDAVMGRGNGPFDCPMAGCRNRFQRSDISADLIFEAKLQAFKKRKAAVKRSQANFDD